MVVGQTNSNTFSFFDIFASCGVQQGENIERPLRAKLGFVALDNGGKVSPLEAASSCWRPVAMGNSCRDVQTPRYGAIDLPMVFLGPSFAWVFRGQWR
jgi:hypothetical protein